MYYDSQKNDFRTAIPDFYLPEQNLIIEVKADWMLDSNITKLKEEYSLKNGYRYITVSSSIIYELRKSSETIENDLLREIFLS